MKKRFLALGVMALFLFTLAGCWAGEITVETIINADGSGERTFILVVMDDTLSTEPIDNPEDPEGTKGKGAVINDKHIVGGLAEIQTWLEENAPSFITVHDMQVEGYNRIFTLSFTFDTFDEFLANMQTLVNLSPVMSWDDFDADELPSFVCEAGQCTFKESRVIVEAAMDWAIDGVYNDIYDADDLAGYVSKADIAVLASYKVTVIDGTYEEMRHYDETRPDGDDPDPVTGDPMYGKIVFVESENFEVTGTEPEEAPRSGSCSSSTNSLSILVVSMIGLGSALGAAHILKRR